MSEIIDLSQELFVGMPVYKDLPQFKMEVSNTHELWEGQEDPQQATPAVYRLQLAEHTGSHVDAFNHMAKSLRAHSIDTMPLEMFYTEGICLDFRHKALKELIEPTEIEAALHQHGLEVKPGDTVLFCTGHYQKHFQTPDWSQGPGLTAQATRWLGRQKVAAFGVETMSPGVPGVSNREVHEICGEMRFTHYENLINLEQLVGRGRFRFIGLPLRIRGGTGSPVRAIAVFE